MQGYYFKDGAFYPISKWTRRIKVTIAAALLFSALTVTSTLHFSEPASAPVPYVEYIQTVNPKVSDREAKQISLSVIRWSTAHNLDEKLVLAVANVESKFDRFAVSTSNALGLMQVIPKWHKEKLVSAELQTGTREMFNVQTNVYLGTKILSDCISRLKELNKALMCYSGNTVGYDKKVLAEYRELKKL